MEGEREVGYGVNRPRHLVSESAMRRTAVVATRNEMDNNNCCERLLLSIVTVPIMNL